MWVRVTDTSASYTRFLSNRDAHTDGFEAGFTSTNKWYLQINGAVSNISSATVNQDQWYHVVWNYDGGLGKIFVDGVQVQNVSFGSQTINTTTAAAIGAVSHQLSSVQNTFEIGALRVYNRSVTASEVKQNYDALKGRYGI